VDFLAVDRDSQISVEIPVHLIDEEEAADDDGVLNQILYTVPILVKPLEVPNYFELSVEGLEVGDVLRVADLAGQLPEGAEFDIEEERTVVTVNAPISEELVFRGLLYRFLHDRGSARFALIVSSLLFALLHASLQSFLPLLFIGLLLAKIYEDTHDIRTPIVFHLFFNLFSFLNLMFLP
jgi:hypothetical protein